MSDAPGAWGRILVSLAVVFTAPYREVFTRLCADGFFASLAGSPLIPRRGS